VKRETEAVIHLFMHLDGSQVLSEATLRQTLDTLAMWAYCETGTRVDYARDAALRTLSLVVSQARVAPGEVAVARMTLWGAS